MSDLAVESLTYVRNENIHVNLPSLSCFFFRLLCCHIRKLFGVTSLFLLVGRAVSLPTTLTFRHIDLDCGVGGKCF